MRLELPPTRIAYNNRNGCTTCDIIRDHQMQYIEHVCKLPHCNLKIKILKCDCEDFWRIYQKSKLNFSYHYSLID